MSPKQTFERLLSIFPILFIGFIANLGLTIVFPFLVFLVFDFKGSVPIYAFVLSLYPATQAIGGPVLGRLADKYGRIPILLLSNIGTTLSWVIFLAALWLPVREIYSFHLSIYGDQIITLPLMMIAFARILDGLTGGNIAVASSYLADISDKDTYQDNFNLMTIALNSGYIVGPTVSALIVSVIFDQKAAIVIAVLLAILISLLGTIAVKLYLAPNTSHAIIREKKKIPRGFRKYLVENNIFFAFAMIFVFSAEFSIFATALPVYVAKELGWGPRDLGIFFGILLAVAVSVMFVVMPILNRKYQSYQIIFFGILAMVPGFFLLPIVEGNLMFYFVCVLIVLGLSLVLPGGFSFIAQKGGEIYQGHIQGVVTTVVAVSSFVGLLIGGLFYDILGRDIFYVGGVGLILLGVLMKKFEKMELKASEDEML